MPHDATDESLPADPLALFAAWMTDAASAETNDPNAMSLATVDGAGRPSVRIVLLKGCDETGFVFYTNLESRKGRDLAANPHAALGFHWKSLRRQVRIEGPVTPVTDADADAYFASRPRESRLGAWASAQSRPLDRRATFEARLAEVATRFPGPEVPRPPHWSGFRLVPHTLEFWREQAFRLHERWVYRRESPGAPWISSLLYP